MKRIHLILTAAATLSLLACSHETHFEIDMPQDQQTQKYPSSTGYGFLGNDLAWEDIADVKSDISHLKYTVTGASGVLETHEFNTPSEASEWIIPLPAGEYDVLVAANMNAANGFELGETVPTKVSHTLPATYTKLTNASSNPRQAWNGITHVTVEQNKMATAYLDLDRLLALFTMKLPHVPEGTVIDVSMRNAADYVTLTKERSSGHWGDPCAEISDDITLGRLTAANALTGINEFKVFPTAKGLEENPISGVILHGVSTAFNFKPLTGGVSIPLGAPIGAVVPFASSYDNTAALATFEAILVPETLAAGALTLYFSVNGKDFQWTNSQALTLEQGGEYTVPVTVDYPAGPVSG